jgi:hypothetical protein
VIVSDWSLFGNSRVFLQNQAIIVVGTTGGNHRIELNAIA